MPIALNYDRQPALARPLGAFESHAPRGWAASCGKRNSVMRALVARCPRGIRQNRIIDRRTADAGHGRLSAHGSALHRVVFIAALALLSGCDDWGREQARERLHLPPYGFEGDPIQGREPYEHVCANCHGIGGTGTEQGPPLVHQVYAPAHHPDTAFHLAVKQGVRQHHWQFGDMPAVDGLTPEQVAHIAAYIRQRQRLAGID